MSSLEEERRKLDKGLDASRQLADTPSAEKGNGKDFSGHARHVGGHRGRDPGTGVMAPFPEEEEREYEPLNLQPLHERWIGPAPPREWVVARWLPARKVTLFYGDGGLGKTLLLMQCGTCVGVAGNRFLGWDTTPGRVLGIFCEDDDDELRRRQEDINRAYNLTMDDMKNVRWISRDGEDNLLCEFEGGDHIRLTDFYWELRETVKLWRPDLLELDTAADTFGGNDISSSHVRQFIKVALGGIVREFGCSILLSAHPSLSGLSSGTGTHGSVQWNNAARSRWYLEKSKENGSEERILTRKKANYAKEGEEIRLQWADGVYWPVVETGSKAKEQERETELAFMDLMSWHADRRLPVSAAVKSSNYAPKLFASHQRSKGISRANYKKAMETLLDDGRLCNEYDSHRKVDALVLRG